MRISLTALLVLLLTISCTGNHNGSVQLTLAEQYGLAYAPLQIAKTEGYIEEQLPDATIKWVKLGNTAAIREAVLGGKVDMGFMGIPPFLIGWDKGMKWKIFTGLSKAELGLVTWNGNITDLKDLGPEDKIALPQPGSIQHILLSMAAGRQLGKADAFDNRLVTMKHPDGMSALLSKRDVTAHFTSPPYVRMEMKEPGMHMILNGKEAMGGDFTFIVGAVTDSLYDKHPEVVEAVKRALAKAMKLIQQNPDKAAAILKDEFSIDEKEIYTYLTDGSLIYSEDIEGVPEFLAFMKNSGYLQKTPKNLNKIIIGNGE